MRLARLIAASKFELIAESVQIVQKLIDLRMILLVLKIILCTKPADCSNLDTVFCDPFGHFRLLFDGCCNVTATFIN